MLHSVDTLATLLRKAAEEHHVYEVTLGHADEDWPTWYATWMLREEKADRDSILGAVKPLTSMDT